MAGLHWMRPLECNLEIVAWACVKDHPRSPFRYVPGTSSYLSGGLGGALQTDVCAFPPYPAPITSQQVSVSSPPQPMHHVPLWSGPPRPSTSAFLGATWTASTCLSRSIQSATHRAVINLHKTMNIRSTQKPPIYKIDGC